MMKKRLAAFVLAAGVLMTGLSGTILAAGTAEDPLVSLSYLTGTFWEEITALVERKIEEYGLELPKDTEDPEEGPAPDQALVDAAAATVLEQISATVTALVEQKVSEAVEALTPPESGEGETPPAGEQPPTEQPPEGLPGGEPTDGGESDQPPAEQPPVEEQPPAETAPAVGLSYEAVQLLAGQTIVGQGGSLEVLLRRGTFVCADPTGQNIVNLTRGGEAGDGNELTLQNLYLLPRDDGRGITCTSGEGWVMARGAYAVQ